MNKLELAHKYAEIILKNSVDRGYNLGVKTGIENIVDVAFDLAEAMLSENEKRQDKSRPEVLEEWQPDWNQAPDGFDWWAVDKDGQSHYYDAPPEIGSGQWLLGGNDYQKGIKFEIYTLNWKDSLRKRP